MRTCLLFSLAARVFSEPLSLPLPKGDASVTLDWNEAAFGAEPSTTYSHSLSRAACYLSDAAYADVLAAPNDSALFTAYQTLGIPRSNIEAHYNIDYTDAMWGNDQCAFSFASKEIGSALGRRTLVFL